MNSHYEKDWVTLLSCGVNSCQSISTQEVMNKVQRKRGGWVYFLLFSQKPLNPTSLLPLTVHVCRSLEVGRIVSSSLQKLMMTFLGDCSALLLFTKGAPDTLRFNSSSIKSCSKTQSSGLALFRCMYGSFSCLILGLCSQHRCYFVM